MGVSWRKVDSQAEGLAPHDEPASGPVQVDFVEIDLFSSVVDTRGSVLSTLVGIWDTLVASSSVLDTRGSVLDTLGSVLNTFSFRLSLEPFCS